MKVSVVITDLEGHSSGLGHFHMAWWNSRATFKSSNLNVLDVTHWFLTFVRWDTPCHEHASCPGWGLLLAWKGSGCKAQILSFLPLQVHNAQIRPLPRHKEMSHIGAGTEIQEILAPGLGCRPWDHPTCGCSNKHHSVTLPEGYSVLCSSLTS